MHFLALEMITSRLKKFFLFIIGFAVMTMVSLNRLSSIPMQVREHSTPVATTTTTSVPIRQQWVSIELSIKLHKVDSVGKKSLSGG